LPIGKKVGCPEGYELVNGNCYFTATSFSQTLAQADPSFNANIEPEKIHTLIPEAYRTTANDGRYVFNLGEQRTTFYAQESDPSGPPEKIEHHEDPHAHHHTTYYAQNISNSTQQALTQAEPAFNANIEPEKIETLIPEAYRTQPNVIVRNPDRRTAFYAQNNTNATASNLVQFDANIEPEKIHTLIPEAYRTTANDGRYVFNLGEQRTTFFSQVDAEVHYDEKNGLWRTNKSFVQTGKTEDDAVGKDNRDPWVYEFTNQAVKDILYDGTRASSPNASLTQTEE
jgi:hypothetical protein